MTILVKQTKVASLFAAVAVMTAFTACSKEEPRETAPAADTIDLSQQVADLFEQPLQPNPMTLSPTDVVITVDGKEITHGEIMQGVQMNMMQISQRVPPQQLAQMAGQMYRNVADTLVANLLLTQAAEKSGLTVSDEYLAKEVASIEANAPEGTSLKDVLAQNKIDFDEWKADLRKQMLVRKLVEEKTADIPEATAAEIATFYETNPDEFKVPETVTASHILLAFNPEDTDETKAQKKQEVEKIRADILAGGDFAAIAAEKSDCPSKARGGDLGTFARGQMVPEFEEAAFTQETGTVGEIVETQFGYHLIKTTAHESARIRSLSEVKDQVKNYLTGTAKRDALLAYIDALKSKADIKMHTPDLDAADPSAAEESK